MKRAACVGLLLHLSLSVSAQTPAPASAATLESAGRLVELCRQAQESIRKARWYPAGKVRLELLERQAEKIKTHPGDIDQYLQFFSVSRQLWWQQNPPTALGEKLREIDEASQKLAWSAGKKLDLPRIGLSQEESGEALLGHIKSETASSALLSHSLSEELRTAPARGRQDLTALDDALHRFEASLQEGVHQKESWRVFNSARVRFLNSYLSLPALDGRTAHLAEALQLLGELGRRAYGSE